MAARRAGPGGVRAQRDRGVRGAVLQADLGRGAGDKALVTKAAPTPRACSPVHQVVSTGQSFVRFEHWGWWAVPRLSSAATAAGETELKHNAEAGRFESSYIPTPGARGRWGVGGLRAAQLCSSITREASILIFPSICSCPGKEKYAKLSFCEVFVNSCNCPHGTTSQIGWWQHSLLPVGSKYICSQLFHKSHVYELGHFCSALLNGHTGSWVL